MNASIGQSTVHPVGLLALILLGVAMLLVPRKYSIWPLIFIACFIPPSQRIVIGSLDFQFTRLMVLFAAARIISRKEYEGIRPNLLDFGVMAHALCKTIIYTIQYETVQAFVHQAGASFDTIGLYLTFRCLVRNFDDIRGLTLGLIFASMPTFVAFTIEHYSGRNLFAFLGYVPEITVIRDGRLRCQGAFAHPILAGVFWASLTPLIAARLFDPTAKQLLTWLGICCSFVIVLFSASSHPILTIALAILFGCLYPLRRYTHFFRWSLFALILGLHMVMKAPVWHLLGRIDLAGGSTGHHRYRLINGAIEFFDEWWMLGTRDTSHWGSGLFDVTNQYLAEGVVGGLATMLLFIGLIVLAFSKLGAKLKFAETYCDASERTILWALGVVLTLNVIGFFAVQYFGQCMIVTWFSLASANLHVAPRKKVTIIQ